MTEGPEPKGYNSLHRCPLCSEEFKFTRDTGDTQPPFPEGWNLYVAHDHGEFDANEDIPPGVWRATVFHRSARGRYPDEAKVVMQLVKDNRKASKVKAQIRNASH